MARTTISGQVFCGSNDASLVVSYEDEGVWVLSPIWSLNCVTSLSS